MEGEDLRTWKNKMVGGVGMAGGYVKKEATALASCFLNTCPPQMLPDSPWGHVDIKSEPGITAEFLMARHEHGLATDPEAEDFSMRRDFNPEKMTGCFLMCGQTPTLVFVEGGSAPGPHQCPRCEGRFPSLRELMDHEPGAGLPPRLSTASKKASGAGGRRSRKRQQQQPRSAAVDQTAQAALGLYTCPTCDKSFAEERLYEVHMRMNRLKPFPCAVCKSHFGSESSLSNHTKHFHKEKHRCPYCPRQYSWKIKLHDHLKQHCFYSATTTATSSPLSHDQ